MHLIICKFKNKNHHVQFNSLYFLLKDVINWHYSVSPDVFLTDLSWFYHNTSLHGTVLLQDISEW